MVSLLYYKLRYVLGLEIGCMGGLWELICELKVFIGDNGSDTRAIYSRFSTRLLLMWLGARDYQQSFTVVALY